MQQRNGIVRSYWHYLIPLVFCLAVMLPRLVSPDFDVEDDGITLVRAEKIIAENQWLDPRVDAGRFRPLYWDGLALIFLIGKTNPFWYYFSNLLLLSLTTVGLAYLVWAKSKSQMQAMLAGSFFVLAGPVIESYYTISKPEAAQAFWLVACLVTVQMLLNKAGWLRKAGFAFAILAAFLSMMFKETSVASLPVAAIFLVYVGLFHRREIIEVKFALTYFLANLAAVMIYGGLMYTMVFIGMGGRLTDNYSPNPRFMLFMMNYWTGWLIRDFMAVLFCLILLLVLARRFGKGGAGVTLPALGCIWMAIWLGIYLPWDRSLEYYLLPFSLGYSIFCGIILGKAVGEFSALAGWRKWSVAVLLFMLALYQGTTVFNNYTNARLQITIDRQSTLLMRYLAANIPTNGSVLVNWSAEATFPAHFQSLLATAGHRPDIVLVPFSYQMSRANSPEQTDYLLLTPVTKNKPLFAVRSVGNTEGESLQAFLPRNAQPVYATAGDFRIVAFNFARLLCGLLHQLPYSTIYCRQSIGIIDTRNYSNGWEVYRYQSAWERSSLPTVFTVDGSWKWQYPDGSVQTIAFGQSADMPLSADWDGNGLTDLVIFRPSESRWYIDLDRDGQADLNFQLSGMQPDDNPLVGDWNCDGDASPAYFRPSDQSWHFWNEASSAQEDLPVLVGGEASAIPLAGDWNGDGCDTIGIYRPDRGEVNLENRLVAELDGVDFYAPRDAIPVPGDWGGQGIDTLAFFERGEWRRTFANCECPPRNLPEVIFFGDLQDVPLSGKWLRP